MITLFACPKPFQGHINLIQRNAIQSWTLLEPKPEIILLGNDEGVADICAEFHLTHIGNIKKNEYGTPLVNSVFQRGQETAKFSIVCYINSDIILMSEFYRGVRTVSMEMSRFLILGQRTDIDITKEINFGLTNWEDNLRKELADYGKLHEPNAMDYFIFPRGMYKEVPPFAIGRLKWDNWLVWNAKSKYIPIVDATAYITIAHQNHSYRAGIFQSLNQPNVDRGNKDGNKSVIRNFDGRTVKLGPEAIQNDELATKDMCLLDIWAASWVLDSTGSIKKRPFTFSVEYIKYQLKWIVPIRWPHIGKLIRWAIYQKQKFA